MNIHITHDGKGSILSVNRSVDGLAHFLVGHGENPVIHVLGERMAEYAIDVLQDAFSRSAVIRVSFSNEAEVVVERHAVLL